MLFFKGSICVIFERFLSVILGFFVVFKWVCVVLVFVCWLVGFFMFIVWVLDCFVREFYIMVFCEDFFFFFSFKIFESVWFLLCFIMFFFLIFYVCCLNYFCGFLLVLNYLIIKKYFWKFVVIFILVCIYDFLIILNKLEIFKMLLYVFFMCEKFFVVVLVLFLNFFFLDKSGLF